MKKKREFLSSFSICFIVVILATLLTWVIPAGGYQTIQYDAGTQKFLVNSADYDAEAGTGEQISYDASQKTLDKFDIDANLESFTSGNISKPISIPGTYEQLEPAHQGIAELLAAPINGVMDAFDIILFLMMLGGTIGVINCIGSFQSGIIALSKLCRGKEQIIIIIVTAVIAFFGTIEGFCEETIALYPVLIPIFLSAGYDGLTIVGSIYMGSCIGCMFSTVNPFSVVLASYTAGTSFLNGIAVRGVGLIASFIITSVYLGRYSYKVKKDPSKSMVPGNREELAKKYSVDEADVHEFTLRAKLTLVIFLLSFATMIWGIITQGWWFTELAEVFLVSGILIGVVGGLKEKEITKNFVNGAAELTGVVLIIGIARAVTIILNNGRISGTILYSLSNAVSHLSPSLFVVMLLFVFMILGFFISSSSGLAVLSIPIMAPLADVVGIPREIIVSAYIFGLGIITFISPASSTVLASMDLVNVNYVKWLKFCAPLLGMLTALAAVLLVVELKIA